MLLVVGSAENAISEGAFDRLPGTRGCCKSTPLLMLSHCSLLTGVAGVAGVAGVGVDDGLTFAAFAASADSANDSKIFMIGLSAVFTIILR